MTTETLTRNKYTERMLDCAEASEDPNRALDLLIDDGMTACPLSRFMGSDALKQCAICELRPGQDFARESPELNGPTMESLAEEFRIAIRNSTTKSVCERNQPAPVPREFYRMLLSVPKNDLPRTARSLEGIKKYTRDIANLREYGALYASDISRITAEKELVVALLTIPPIMQRNFNHDFLKEDGRETDEMAELMGRMFNYAIERSGYDNIGADLSQILQSSLKGAPDEISSSVDGMIKGVSGEVAVFRAIQSNYRHGTKEEDMKGRDFVNCSNPKWYVDVKCKQNRPDGRGGVVPVTEVYLDERSRRLYIPPQSVDDKTFSLDEDSEREIRRLLHIDP